MEKEFRRRKALKIPYHLILIFLILSLGIGIAGYMYYGYHRDHIKNATAKELSAIAELKTKEIFRWRKEHIGDASVILESPFLITNLQKFLQKPDDFKLKNEVIAWMKSLQMHYNYKSLVLTDVNGNVKLAFPDGKEVLGPDAKKFIDEATEAKKVMLSDLYRSKITGAIHHTAVVPLFELKKDDNSPFGVLMLRINPYDFLYPYIQSWPTISDTGETLLVKREGNEVVFLNELRHKRDTVLNLRFPLSKKDLPAAMVIQGAEGVVEGIDYRGKPVLAALIAVPDSQWFLVSKIDLEEVFAPLYERLRLIIGLVSVLIVFSGLALAFIWRRQEAGFYQQQYEVELQYSSELKRIENALLESEQKLRDIIKYSTNLFYSHTPDHILTYMSPQTRYILDCEPEEALVRWTEFATDNPVNQKGYELTQKAIDTGEQQPPYELELMTKKGRKIWVEVREAPVVRDGKTVAIVGALTDITERKKTEEELKRYREHLENLVKERTAELERINEQLTAANKELEAFSYSVSHDLRAPLRAIDGFSGILFEEYYNKLDDEAKRILNIIRDNTRNMGVLIDDLLTLSRIGRQEIVKSNIEMVGLAKSVSQELTTLETERNINIEIKELPPAYGDPIMIRQVFVNLLSNAIKFTRPRDNAVIEVNGYETDEDLIYYVRDNGVGFDENYKDKLFGVFQRLHSADEFEGTGVGLAIVKRIVNRQGGAVWAEGQVGRGATFYFSLPEKIQEEEDIIAEGGAF